MDNKDYGDNFDFTNGKTSNDYDLDNFDVDAADNFSHTVHSEAEETSRADADDDYGDNFDSQTGEDNKNYSSCASSFSFQSFSCLIKALRSSSSFL